MTRDFGTVKKWNVDRGYGFIAVDGGTPGRDVFIHIKGTRHQRELSVGDRVSFLVAPDPRDGSKVLAVDAVVVK